VPKPRTLRRPSPTVELTSAQLEALQAIRDQVVHFCSVPGAPGRARYRYFFRRDATDSRSLDHWKTIPSPTVVPLLQHGLIQHGERQHDGREWSERVTVSLRADLVLRRAKASATTGATKAAKRKQVADARAAAAKLPAPAVDLDALAARVPGAGRAWVLSVPPIQLLNANDRFVREQETRMKKVLRETGRNLARAARIPRLQAAHVIYVVHLNTRASKGDPGNLAPTAKALIDGAIGDANVLPDDNSRYLTGPEPIAGERVPLKGGRISLVIIELPEGISA
jgi:hypothetical protein